MNKYKKRKKEEVKVAVVRAVVQRPQLKLKPKPITVPTPVRAKQFLEELKKTYPVLKLKLPLSIGVGKQLHGLYPDQPNRIINTALYLHTHNKDYLKNLTIQNSPRYNLDGLIEGEIDSIAAHRAYTFLQKVKPKRPKRNHQK